MGRLRHFEGNVGWWGVVRTFGVAALFLVIAVLELVREGEPFVLAGLLVAVVVPRVLLGWLVGQGQRALVGLRWMGFALVGSAVLLSVTRERLDLEGPWFLPALTFVVVLYLSAYFWMLSDRHAVRDADA